MDDKIYVIGDSHTSFFSGNEMVNFIPFIKEPEINVYEEKFSIFRAFHLGPVLAYNTNRKGSKNQGREKVELLIEKNYLPKGSRVLCCFGEIDLRSQVFKQVQQRDLPYQVVVDDILAHYLEFLLWLQAQGYQVMCWGPIASRKDKWKCFDNPDTPDYGKEQERNKATEYFNSRLNEICKINGIQFISIFSKMINNQYRTKIKYISADSFHLSQSATVLAYRAFLFNGDRILSLGEFINLYFWRITRKFCKVVIKLLCLFIPVKSWRHKLRSFYK